MLLSIKDLSVSYGKNQALKNINLDIEPNTVTAIIGPSGCGKSTFLRSLNRLTELTPNTTTRGSINYKEHNIYEMDPMEVRYHIGMVFQKPNPFPKSIYENVAFGPKLNGYDNNLQEIVEESLKKADLWLEVKDRLKDNAYTLSGGQQQRLCIARSLAVKPDILLMDEPTSALDPLSTAKIEDLMTTLKEHYTIIIVTHNMQQAGRVADNVAFFLNGELIEYGSSEKIFTKPFDKRTEDYITGRFG